MVHVLTERNKNLHGKLRETKLHFEMQSKNSKLNAFMQIAL